MNLLRSHAFIYLLNCIYIWHAVRSLNTIWYFPKDRFMLKSTKFWLCIESPRPCITDVKSQNLNWCNDSQFNYFKKITTKTVDIHVNGFWYTIKQFEQFISHKIIHTNNDYCDALYRTPNNKKILVVEPETDAWLDFTKGEKAYCHLGGNSILGRFFRGGKDGPGMIFPRGKFCTRPIFPGGKSNPGPFFRGESLCGGKVYATTPGPSFPPRKNRPSIEFPPKRQYAFSPFVKSRHAPSPVLLLEFSYYLEFCLVHHHSNLITLCEINHSNCVMVYWNSITHLMSLSLFFEIMKLGRSQWSIQLDYVISHQ